MISLYLRSASVASWSSLGGICRPCIDANIVNEVFVYRWETTLQAYRMARKSHSILTCVGVVLPFSDGFRSRFGVLTWEIWSDGVIFAAKGSLYQPAKRQKAREPYPINNQTQLQQGDTYIIKSKASVARDCVVVGIKLECDITWTRSCTRERTGIPENIQLRQNVNVNARFYARGMLYEL